MKFNILAFLGLFLFAFVIGWQVGESEANQSWQLRWETQATELAMKQYDAIAKARAEDTRRINQLEEIVHEYDEQIKNVSAAAVAADVVAGRMHEQASKLASRGSACPHSATTTDRSAAGRATDTIVLAELFKRSDAVAGELAAAYDRARAAGLACERAYDSLRTI